jgi:hypothetical protein
VDNASADLPDASKVNLTRCRGCFTFVMSGLFYMGVAMSSEEKRAWIMVVVTAISYAVYVAIILGRAGDVALVDVPYAATMIWTIVAAIVASIVLNIAAAIVNPKDANKRDTRDREINQFGERIGQSFVIAGAVAALLLAMAKWEYFWISNAIYLGFVLSALVASGAKIVAYRRGFQKW